MTRPCQIQRVAGVSVLTQSNPNMPGTTKQERDKRVIYAKRALIKAGWSPDQPSSGVIVDDLMTKFAITDRRTARRLEAKAARLLRGDVVTDAKLGRPRKYVRVLIDRMPAELRTQLEQHENVK